MTTRIMVVDDEPAIGKLLMYQLAGFGYQVSYVQNGLEALQRLPAAHPDLVMAPATSATPAPTPAPSRDAVDPNPPNPHKGTTREAIDPNPPNPHKGA